MVTQTLDLDNNRIIVDLERFGNPNKIFPRDLMVFTTTKIRKRRACKSPTCHNQLTPGKSYPSRVESSRADKITGTKEVFCSEDCIKERMRFGALMVGNFESIISQLKSEEDGDKDKT